MNQYLLVFLGGGIGSALRLGTYRLARLWLPPEFPWGTFSVNVVGGLCAGMVTGWLMGRSAGGADPAALFLMTGVLGGFTTFSAFSVDAVLLFQRGSQGAAILYVMASLTLSVAATILGLWLIRQGA
jgi:CrcB protein